MVKTQRERKRVSQANRPCVSAGVASMLPARSLTTKVLPSRMLTVFSGIALTDDSLKTETKRQVAGDLDRPADRGRDEVLLAGDDSNERVGVARQDAVSWGRTAAHDKFATTDRHPTAARAFDIEFQGAADMI